MSQGQATIGPNPWVENLFRPLSIGVMFGCVALSLVSLVRLLFPDWNGTFLVVGCVLAALEANYSYRLVRAMSLRGGDLLRFRAIEIAMFFILLKIGSYVGDSPASVLADVRTWPAQIYRVFDAETVAAFVLVLFSWYAATRTVRDFERINEPVGYGRYYVAPLDSLAGRFFWGGAVLLIAAGLTRIGIAELFKLSRPPVPGLVLNVLVYFLLGLVMLGQVRFATLRKRWQTQDIKVADDLAGRWVRYSLVFIGLAAFLAFLLPTGYTLGLLESICWVLFFVASVITFVAMMLFWLITFPFAWLWSRLGGDLPASGPSQPPTPPVPYEPTTYAGPDWFQLLRSLAFWAIALGIIFYVVRSYLRDHPELLDTLARLGLIRAIRRVWAALWAWLGGWGVVIRERMPRRWPLRLGRRASSSREPIRFFRLGGLSPREQILYYYLSILHRARQHGIPRRAAQTPHEYSATLEPSLPEAQQEMGTLTDAFVEARYSRHTIGSDRASRVRASWQQVKAALRDVIDQYEQVRSP